MFETALGLVEASIVPAIVCGVSLLLIWRSSSNRVVPGWTYGLVVAAAFCAGCVVSVRLHVIDPDDRILALRPDWAAIPARNSQWLFYLAAAAGIVGAVGSRERLPVAVRWLLAMALSLAAAWLLTQKPNLTLPRAVWVSLLSVYIFGLTALVDGLCRRQAPGPLLALLGLAAAAMAALTAYYANQSHGQLLAGAAAALAAAALVAWMKRQSNRAIGAGISYAVIAGGFACVGVLFKLNLSGLLIAAAAPIALWMCVLGPISRLRGISALAAQAAIVLIVAAFAAVVLRLAVGS
jgi:hypothetical protein